MSWSATLSGRFPTPPGRFGTISQGSDSIRLDANIPIRDSDFEFARSDSCRFDASADFCRFPADPASLRLLD
eukprot:2374993-Pyramimonas_sp.AAC.1